MLVHTESRSLLLRVKNPDAIKAILPKHKDIDFQGHNLAVRHGLDEVRVLRNLGINAPPPILYHYRWPGKFVPHEHQRQTAAFFTLHQRCFCLNQMGTEKTASALWAADYLMDKGYVRRVLVIAPLSTLNLVWMREIFSVLMHRRAAMLHASRQRRQELFAEDFDIYVINHHGLATIAPQLATRKDVDLIIVDEASRYRNSRTDLYSTLAKCIGNRRLWLLTGSPCPNAPTDAWALARLVDKGRVPMYFTQWRRQTMIQVNQYKWVPRRDSAEMAFRAMQPAIRYLKKECLDLPPLTTEERQCELSTAQATAYKAMKNRMVLEANAAQITAVNAADQVNKLRQVLCGVIKDTRSGTYECIDHSPRFQLLLECIEDALAKVIVVVPFKGIIEVLQQELSSHYSCAVLNGDVPMGKRTAIVTAFKTTPDPHVLLCHPEVTAHGLSFVEADTTIFYGPIYSSEWYDQVIERFNRSGQKHKMTVIRIGASWLEWEIYRMNDEKRLSQENILSLYKREVLGV